MKLRTRIGLVLLTTGLVTACGEKAGGTPEDPAPETTSHPWDFKPEDPALLAGRETYLAECALCHNEGEEGAPALGSRSQWDIREAKGFDTLLKHAIEGFIGEDGEMPARGGTDTLTDREVEQAVRYMLAARHAS